MVLTFLVQKGKEHLLNDKVSLLIDMYYVYLILKVLIYRWKRAIDVIYILSLTIKQNLNYI